ncbi:MAG: rho, partial [Ilumatobacteraceae bacterium]|nr:rho [Ilumatobacteraceae bacterium]
MAAEALEQSMLESKDKDQLLAIAQALGIKTTARAAKATLITKILETTGSGPSEAPVAAAPVTTAAATNGHKSSGRGTAEKFATAAATDSASATDAADSSGHAPGDDATTVPEVVLGPDGEPLADWEIDLMRSGEAPADPNAAAPARRPATTTAPSISSRSSTAASTASQSNGATHEQADDQHDGASDDQGDDEGADDGPGGEGQDGESRNSRRRRRRRNKNGRTDGPQGTDRFDAPRDRPAGNNNNTGASNAGPNNSTPDRAERADRDEKIEPISQEPVKVSGYLDLRDEGYGFLRVAGYLASRDDAYIPVKLTRQYGLRKGDHVTGLSRPAGRNEKNPAMLEIHTVNDGDPELARNRKRFEDLTALFPDEKLRLENPNDVNNMTARIIDLISPIGKGQRGIIVSPPKAGKTTIMKTIATSIEQNHPEVKLIVLLIDERPEEVTDMRRTVKGEVISSTFDRPSDEHTHVAELAIEKAKRLVEMGEDVVIILDGITRLSRAYNLAAPASGRILSGGIDAGALYPPKKFFGAARNVEEGGSLTILATALVETNSRMDEAIFEEFKGTGNMELRLDRKLAERRIYPAIDVDASSTRHEELLFARTQLQQVWKLRRVLQGLAEGGSGAAGLELL